MTHDSIDERDELQDDARTAPYQPEKKPVRVANPHPVYTHEDLKSIREYAEKHKDELPF